MREHFQWGDTDGNNGYYYQELTPAELQAAWELRCALKFTPWNSDSKRPIRIQLHEQGKPCLEGIPLEKDAQIIRGLIEFRAKQIEESGDINPPSIDDIRDSMWD